MAKTGAKERGKPPAGGGIEFEGTAMKKPILDDLEKYLAGEMSPDAAARFEAALDGEGQAQMAGFREQNEMLRTLRAPEEMDPAAGFYARVMERIESQAAASLWSVFFEPLFAKKLAFASLALLVVLSSAAMTANPSMHEAVPLEIVAESVLEPAPGTDAEHDRQVVFASLAGFAGGEPVGLMPASMAIE